MHKSNQVEFTTQVPIRVVLGEDQPLMRQAMADEFRRYPGVEVAGMAGTIPELEQLLEQLEPDMLVLEITLEGGYVSQLLQRYLRRQPGLRVLVASAWATEFHCVLSRKAGAHGFLSKQAGADERRRTFWAVARGQQVWPAWRSSPVAAAAPFDREARFQALTVREMEVFGLIGRWKSTEEMAESLGISPKTVEIHRIHIKRKLRLNSASGLLRYAVERVRMEQTLDEFEAGDIRRTVGSQKEQSNGLLSYC